MNGIGDVQSLLIWYASLDVLNQIFECLVLLCLCWRLGKQFGTKHNRLPASDVRYVITLAVGLLQSFVLLESCLRTAYSLTHVVPATDVTSSAIGLISCALTVAFYSRIETHACQPSYLWVTVVLRLVESVIGGARISLSAPNSAYFWLHVLRWSVAAAAGCCDALGIAVSKVRQSPSSSQSFPARPTITSANVRRSGRRVAGVSFDPHATVRHFVPEEKPKRLRYAHRDANLVSRLTFSWFVEVIRWGRRRPLEFEDIDTVTEEESSEIQFQNLSRVYKKGNSIWANLWVLHRWQLLVGGVLKFLGDLVNVVGPLLILPIVSYVRDTQNPSATIHRQYTNGIYWMEMHEFMRTGWVLAWVALLASLLQSTLSQKSSHTMTMAGMRARSALQVLVYEKSLKVAIWEGRQRGTEDPHSEGECGNDDASLLINMTSEDCDHVMSFITQCQYIWAIPLKIVVLVALLSWQLGYAALLASFLTILLLVPLQLLVIKNIASVSKSLADSTDERLRRTHELVAMMKSIKVNNWQDIFTGRVSQARKWELSFLFKDALLRALMTFLTQSSGIAVVLVAFGLFSVLNDEQLDSGTVFASLALFSQLTVPLFILPSVIVHTVKAKRSMARIEAYLANEEVPPKETFSQQESQLQTEDDGGKVVIRVQDVTFSTGCHDEATLNNISLDILKGELNVVVGGVGSGKTSLLLGLLGELNTLHGQVFHRALATGGSIAYVSQTPWLLNCTLRENILFGKPYSPQRYRRVVSACALDPDIDILPCGDDTEIGEQGINLSGGQRQRVAIARALYSDAEILFLDSPFSALDASVAQEVFEKAVLCFLLKKKKTVLLATQHPRFVRDAHKVIFVNHKTVECQGSAQHVSARMPRTWNVWLNSLTPETAPGWKPSTERERTLLRRNTRFFTLAGSRKFLSSQMGDCVDSDFVGAYHSGLTYTPFEVSLSSRAAENVTAARHQALATDGGLVRTFSSNGRVSERSSRIDRRYTKSLPPQTRPGTRKRRKDSPFFAKKSLKASFKQKSGSGDVCLSRSGSLDQCSSWDEESLHVMLNDTVYKSSIDEHDRKRGRVSRWNYVAYCKACGWLLAAAYIIASFCNQGVSVCVDLWLGHWSRSSQQPLAQAHLNVSETIAHVHQQSQWYMVVFGLLSGASVIMVCVTILLAQVCAHVARRRIHCDMVEAVAQASFQFFEANPCGRIINRFATDVAMIDKELGWSLMHLVYFSLLCGSAIVVNMAISPVFVVVSLPICIAYYILQSLFRRSSRELKRLESLSLSPLFCLISETAASPVTIRAHGIQQQFVSCFQQRLNNYLGVSILLHSGTRWLGISLDYLGGAIVFVATITCLVGSVGLAFGPVLTPAQVGLAIKYTLVVPVYLNWLVRFLSDTEMCLNSMERIHQYSSLQSEQTHAQNSIPNVESKKEESYTQLKSTCHRSDILSAQSLCLRYEDAQVVCDVSFSVPRGQKVGVCGRTGSGKSTLLMGILRVVEPQPGSLLFGGTDVLSMPLEMLRSRISTVLQEPHVFQHTLRFNLDPTEQFMDEALWSALEDVQLHHFVKRQPLGLDLYVSSNNLSVGQLQLLSFARVILEQRPLILLDEATSALDSQSEKDLLHLLRRKLPHSTIISVAHNVDSLLLYDRLLVMDQGHLLQDGEPASLAQQDGVFATLLASAHQSPSKK